MEVVMLGGFSHERTCRRQTGEKSEAHQWKEKAVITEQSQLRLDYPQGVAMEGSKCEVIS